MARRPWEAVAAFLTRPALDVFRRLPRHARRLVTRVITPNYTVGAVALARDDDGRILLVRSRHNHGWALPGGLLRRGERPLAGLARELDEELGLVVAADSLSGLQHHTVIDADSQQVTVVVEVELPGPPRVDGIEVLETGWFGVDEIPSRLVRQTVEHLRVAGIVI